MSLVYKALENAKSKNAQLAAKEPGLEDSVEKQNPSRLNAKMKWIWGVTALTVGGGLMLANAGQFAINERVASSQSNSEVKPVADVAVEKPFEPTIAPKALVRLTEAVATLPVAVAQIDKPAAKLAETTFAAPLAEARSAPLPTAAVLTATPREQVSVDTREPSENQPQRFVKTIVANDRRSQQLPAAIHTKQPYDVNLSDNGGSVSANKPRRHAALEHIVSSAKQAIRSKNFTTAEIKLQSLGDIAGTESMVYKRLSAYYLGVIGDSQGAATAYQNIIAMAPNDLEAGYNLALLESQLGRLEQAKNRVRFLKEQFPQSGAVDKLAKSINK